MAIRLGPPQKPPARVRVPKRPRPKPKKPKATTGNVYRSTPPRRFNPVPSAALVNRALAYRPPGSAGATATGNPLTAPAPPPDPDARWKEWAPWAIAGRDQIDREAAAHQAYLTDKVMPWLSSSLTGLNAYSDAAQNAYMGAVQGASGAYGASAAMTPLNYATNSPGGSTANPDSYLTAAGRDYALGTGNVATQLAAHQTALAKLQPNTLSKGFINSLADYAKGLPAIYSERRREYTDNVEQFIAQAQASAAEAAAEQARWEVEQTERQRHNRVSESISATNAQTNAAIQFGRLGLESSDQAFDNRTQGAPDPSTIPVGYVAVPDGKGGWKVQRDPTYSQPGSGPKPSTKGTYTANQLKKEGFVGGWKVKPAGKVGASAVRATNGLWYAKPKGASGSGSTPKTPENLRQELDTWYFGKVDGKYDAPAATRRVGNWILSRKKRFTRKDGTVNFDAIASLIVDVIGGSTIPAGVRDFLRPYVVNGRWK